MRTSSYLVASVPVVLDSLYIDSSVLTTLGAYHSLGNLDGPPPHRHTLAHRGARLNRGKEIHIITMVLEYTGLGQDLKLHASVGTERDVPAGHNYPIIKLNT